VTNELATNEQATNEQEFEFYARIYCYRAGVEGARRPQDKNSLLGYRTLGWVENTHFFKFHRAHPEYYVVWSKNTPKNFGQEKVMPRYTPSPWKK